MLKINGGISTIEFSIKVMSLKMHYKECWVKYFLEVSRLQVQPSPQKYLKYKYKYLQTLKWILKY